jgi:hypothetical protein
MANLASPFTVDPLSSATGFTSPGFAVDSTGNISMNGNLVLTVGNITNGSTVLLTPTTLGSGITGSSLTSLGTLTSLTVTNPITGNITGYSSSIFSQNSTLNVDLSNNVSIVSNATYTWGFQSNGITSFPNYKFPLAHGTSGQVLVDDGAGNLGWTTLNTGGGGAVITANNLTGTTLNATITASSLTSVGTLGTLTVTGLITSNGGISGGSASHSTGSFSGNITAATVPTQAGHVTNKLYVDSIAAALAVGLS